jgi:hypothetical protein
MVQVNNERPSGSVCDLCRDGLLAVRWTDAQKRVPAIRMLIVQRSTFLKISETCTIAYLTSVLDSSACFTPHLLASVIEGRGGAEQAKKAPLPLWERGWGEGSETSLSTKNLSKTQVT